MPQLPDNWAFLTSGQKAELLKGSSPSIQATTPSGAVVNAAGGMVKPPREIGSLSSEKGLRALTQAQATEARLTPPPQAPTTPQEPTKEPQAPTSKVTLLNPTTGQSLTYDNPDINRDNIQSSLSSGYQLAEASGALPAWLKTTPQGTTTTQTPEEMQIQKDQAEYDASITKLKNFAQEASNDPALLSMLQSIEASWNQRVKEQEQANKSRTAAMQSAGIRLGSRYAGGNAGPMASIISAEERAGLDRIDDLNRQKQSALLEARSAFESKKWDQYAKFVDLAEKNLAESKKAFADLNKTIIEEQKLRDERAKVQFQQEETERKAIFDYSERIAPMVLSEAQTLPPEQQAEFIQQVALKLGVDPNLLSGDIAKADLERDKELLTQENLESQILERIAESKRQETELGFSQQRVGLEKERLGLERRRVGIAETQERRLGGTGTGVPIVVKQTTGTQAGQPVDTSPLVSAFNQVAYKLPQNNRNFIESEFTKRLSTGDVQGARDVVVDAVEQTADAETQRKLLGRKEAVSALNAIEQSLAEYQARGGNTGLLTGTTEQIANKLGRTQNTEVASIGNDIRLAIVAYRNAVSGAAFTESEKAEYDRLFPSVGKVPALNKAKIDSLRTGFDRNNKVFYENRLKGSYETVFPKTYMVTSPTGEKLQTELTSEQVATFKAKGYTVK
jgi:hypothetical protein